MRHGISWVTQERSDNKLDKKVAARFSSSHWVRILTFNDAYEDVRPLLMEAQEVIWMTCTTSEWSLF